MKQIDNRLLDFFIGAKYNSYKLHAQKTLNSTGANFAPKPTNTGVIPRQFLNLNYISLHQLVIQNCILKSEQIDMLWAFLSASEYLQELTICLIQDRQPSYSINKQLINVLERAGKYLTRLRKLDFSRN